LRIHIYFTLKPAHISFKDLILPNCIVIITKIIRSLDALSTCRDRMSCVEATQGAVAGHPSDGEDMKTSESALEGLVSLVIRKGYFIHSVASI
jgi:hypothetical protein